MLSGVEDEGGAGAVATAAHTPPSANILNSALLRGRSPRGPWRYLGGGASGRIPQALPASTKLTRPRRFIRELSYFSTQGIERSISETRLPPPKLMFSN